MLERTRKPVLPDLVVAKGALLEQLAPNKSDNWGTRVPKHFLWEAATRNIGRAIAPPSKTGVVFSAQAGPPDSQVLDEFDIPGLLPRGKKNVIQEFSHDLRRLAYGPYDTSICANIKFAINEKPVTNDCNTRGPFYVVPHVLKGGVEGTWKVGAGQVIHWSGIVQFTIACKDSQAEAVFSPTSWIQKQRFLSSRRSETPKTVPVAGRELWSIDHVPSGDAFEITFGKSSGYLALFLVNEKVSLPDTFTCKGGYPIPGNTDISSLIWLYITNGQFKGSAFKNLTGQSVGPDKVTYNWRLDAADE